MKYHPPYGSTDPDASYVDKNVPGAVRGSPVPAAAIEATQREIVNFIQKSGIIPDDDLQLALAVQAGKVNFAVAGGTANAITAALDPAPEALPPGLRILLVVTAANTSPVATLNLNGIGAKNVYRRNSDSLAVGDLKPGINELIYDGTHFRLANAAFVGSIIAANGYVDLPGGITIQWGGGRTVSGSLTVTFPKAFSTAPYTMCATDVGANGWATNNATFLGIGVITATTAVIRAVTWNGSGMQLGTADFSYIAIGPT